MLLSVVISLTYISSLFSIIYKSSNYGISSVVPNYKSNSYISYSNYYIGIYTFLDNYE